MPRGIYQRKPIAKTIRDNLMRRELRMLFELESFLIDVDNAVESNDLPAIDRRMMLNRIRQLIGDEVK